MDSYDLPHFRSRTFREILPGVSVILPPKTGMWELGGYNGLNVFVPTLNKPYIILKEEMRVTRIPNQEISLDLTDFAIALGPSSIVYAVELGVLVYSIQEYIFRICKHQ